MMYCRLLIAILFVLTLTPQTIFAQTTSDYLILQDIGSYKLDKLEKMLPGRPPMGGPETFDSPGIVGPADHFSLDHADKTYKVMYIGGNGIPSPTVQVTKHSGSDSDKWLLHELELGFQKAGTLGAAYAAPNPLRNISGNNIYFMWGHYEWVSNYVVVAIQFTDLAGAKPEPLEVVQAYLQKYPSTMPTTLVLDNAHKIQWIKDEVDRQLWLCDKWFYQLQLGKVDQIKVNQESVGHMGEFLDYREKYYSIKAADEKNLLAGHLNNNNGTGIKAKLDEYKKWWVVNKDKAISL